VQGLCAFGDRSKSKFTQYEHQTLIIVFNEIDISTKFQTRFSAESFGETGEP
jgi:hypothetical protein